MEHLDFRIRQVVLRHLPNSKDTGVSSNLPTFADWYTSYISGWHERGSENFGQSEDADKLFQIDLHLQTVLRLLSSLTGDAYRDLRFPHTYMPSELGDDPSFDMLACLKVLGQRASKAASGPYYSKQADRKRNWKAIAVAEAARRVWGMEQWREEGGSPDQFFKDLLDRRAQDEIWRIAPISQHHDRPGPFGRFLTDLLDAFEIRARDGAPVSAATALNALRNLYGQSVHR